MPDFLDQLLAQRLIAEPTAANLATLQTRALVQFFLDDCAARNLQPGTIAFYRLNLTYLVDAAGDRLPAAFISQHLRLLIQYYREVRHWSIGTTNHVIASWRAFFNYLKQERVIGVNPMDELEKLKGPQYLPEPYTREEIRRLLDVIQTGRSAMRDRTMLLLLLDTGMRLGELMGLALGDLSLTQQRVRVFGKGRKERVVPFSDPVRQVVGQYLDYRQQIAFTDALWINHEGNRLTEAGFVTQFRRLAKAAKVERAHIHRFRHTFATEYLRNGGSPQHLQRLLGHTTPTMTQQYTHLTDTDACADHIKASPMAHMLGE